MTDLEITRLCAEAMGWKGWRSKHGYWNITDPEGNDSVRCNGWLPFDAYTGDKLPEPTLSNALAECGYDHLHDDAQCMALVKKFRLSIGTDAAQWYLVLPDWPYKETNHADLNRAICECVAKMQLAKVKA